VSLTSVPRSGKPPSLKLSQFSNMEMPFVDWSQVAWCYSRLGSAYLEIEEYDKAVDALQRCLKVRPQPRTACLSSDERSLQHTGAGPF
jgi:tetratricopeptide (TPR) repeat protein